MTSFLATISPGSLGNWQICKREGLWGVKEAGGAARTGTANAMRVARGDRIFVWLSRNPRDRAAPGGIAAELEVLGPFVSTAAGARIPWPEPEAYAGSFPIVVVEELRVPVGDRFVNQVSLRFGIENIALVHGFRMLDDPLVVDRIQAEFGQ